MRDSKLTHSWNSVEKHDTLINFLELKKFLLFFQPYNPNKGVLGGHTMFCWRPFEEQNLEQKSVKNALWNKYVQRLLIV